MADEYIKIEDFSIAEQLNDTDYLIVDQTDQDRKVSLAVLKSFVSEDFIGTIQHFVYSSGIPEGYLLCDGSLVNRADYPKLYTKIGDTYKQDGDKSTTQFRVPNLLGYFLRNTTEDVPLGTLQTDTMRKLTGYGGETQINSNGNAGDLTDKTATGIFFPTNNAKIIEGVWSSVDSTVINRYALKIDSSYGVEGQEGTASPNVGAETRPKNMSVVFAIKAK